ncbi:MAG: hypothetical protein WCO56_07015 [Verrucomicrobiota bacterium]
MKTIKNILTSLTRGTWIAAVAGITLAASNGMAQDRGATQLIKPHPHNSVAEVQKVAAGDPAVMACPKCKDSLVTEAESTGKGANPTVTKTYLQHGCPTCSTKIATEGVGKNAKDTVKHSCKSGSSEGASCCAMK